MGLYMRTKGHLGVEDERIGNRYKELRGPLRRLVAGMADRNPW